MCCFRVAVSSCTQAAISGVSDAVACQRILCRSVRSDVVVLAHLEVHPVRNRRAVASAACFRKQHRRCDVSVVARQGGAAHDFTDVAAAGVLGQGGRHRRDVHGGSAGQVFDQCRQDAGSVGVGRVADFDDRVEPPGADGGFVQGGGVVGGGQRQDAGIGLMSMA